MPRKKVNVGERLVQLIEQSLSPFLAPSREVYVGMPRSVNGAVSDGQPPRVHVRITHEDVSDWVLRSYYDGYAHEMPTAQQVASAIGVAKARAREDGKEPIEVPVRMHYQDGALYIDLCRHDMQMVKVTPGHWEVMTNRPDHTTGFSAIKFRRPGGMGEMPLPVEAGKGHICDIRQFLNLRGPQGDINYYRLVAWLLGCFMPDGDRPVLVLNGGKGSGKSSIAWMLHTLADPAEADLLQPPKDEAAIALRAFNSWVVAYDNLTKLDTSLSDSLCRLSTGSVLTKRRLYTDDGEVIWKVKRSVIINGIQRLAVKDDLSERSLVVDLPAIPERKGEKATRTEYEATFKEAWPSLFGALLDVVADGMKRLPAAKEETDKRYRMGDLHLWIAACSPALGWAPDTATAIMEASKERTRAELFENEPVLAVLNDFLWQEGVAQDDGARTFRGSHQEMLAKLRTLALAQGLNVNDHRLDFPAKAQMLAAKEQRYKLELEARGVAITETRPRHGNRMYIWALSGEESRPVEVPPYQCGHALGGLGGPESAGPPTRATTLSPGSNGVREPQVALKVQESELPLENRRIYREITPEKGFRATQTPSAQATTGASVVALVGGLENNGPPRPPTPSIQLPEVTPETATWAHAYRLLPICPNPHHKHDGMMCNVCHLPSGIYDQGFLMPTGTIRAVYDANGDVENYQTEQGGIRAAFADEAAALYLQERGETLGPRLTEKLAALDDGMERERRKLACEHPHWEAATGRFGAAVLRCRECGAMTGADLPRAVVASASDQADCAA